jgi:DNA-binding response OmpR family regulator
LRILIVEDDQEIVDFLRQGLTESGYQVAAQQNGEDGYLDARYNSYDLIVLDLSLPEMDGIDIAHRLRREGANTPILILTARDTEQEKVLGLDTGADDYMTKPFGFAEFLARVRALLRRDALSHSSVMHFADLHVDTAARRVYRGGREIVLSAREYALLEYLAYHAGQVVTRELLIENVWSDAEIESNVIDVYIGYLRHKIDAPFYPPLIRTVRGLGYSLRAP